MRETPSDADTLCMLGDHMLQIKQICADYQIQEGVLNKKQSILGNEERGYE